MHHVKKLGGGWYDTPLTEKRKTDARRIALHRAGQIETTNLSMYSSDLLRCTDMATIFQDVFKRPFIPALLHPKAACGHSLDQR